MKNGNNRNYQEKASLWVSVFSPFICPVLSLIAGGAGGGNRTLPSSLGSVKDLLIIKGLQLTSAISVAGVFSLFARGCC